MCVYMGYFPYYASVYLYVLLGAFPVASAMALVANIIEFRSGMYNIIISAQQMLSKINYLCAKPALYYITMRIYLRCA